MRLERARQRLRLRRLAHLCELVDHLVDQLSLELRNEHVLLNLEDFLVLVVCTVPRAAAAALLLNLLRLPGELE